MAKNKRVVNTFKSIKTFKRNILTDIESWQTAWQNVQMLNKNF